LGIPQLAIVEGSGISRANRISADGMRRVLAAFHPHRHLLRQDGREAYKTGTLRGIQTRAGYVSTSTGQYGYVIMLNSGQRRMGAVMPSVHRFIDDHAGGH
jgi:D-alanyl-D-alanine carboxypeptidase/D-alanyl-D-alanine-endopeptidase (penicillin-binding protein 4)